MTKKTEDANRGKLLREYAKLSEETAVYPRPDKPLLLPGRLVYPVLGLSNEAGEVLGKVKKAIRDDNCEITPKRRLELADELSDVFWYWYRCCIELGYDPETIIRHNMEKLRGRLDRGTIKGEGDER